MNIRRPRTWRAALVAAGAAVALTSCASSHIVDAGAPAALPQPSYFNYAQTDEFSTLFSKLDQVITDDKPIRGTLFKHASFGKRSLNAEFDVVLVGSPAGSLFVRSRVPQSAVASNLDTLHLVGSRWDYFLLGPAYRSIATTPWVRVPTVYGNPLNVCLLTGYQTICDMEDAVTITKQEGVQAVHRVSYNEDGTVTLVTGVTLRSMLKYNFLLNVPRSISSQFTPAMLNYQLSTRFTITTSGQLKFAEIVGIVPGKIPFVVQVGYQVTGVPSASDLPQLPPASEVTTLTNAAFDHQLDAIDGD